MSDAWLRDRIDTYSARLAAMERELAAEEQNAEWLREQLSIAHGQRDAAQAEAARLRAAVGGHLDECEYCRDHGCAGPLRAALDGGTEGEK